MPSRPKVLKDRALTHTERQQRMEANYADAGIVRSRVWIPKEKRDELHRLAEQWREEHLAALEEAS